MRSTGAITGHGPQGLIPASDEAAVQIRLLHDMLCSVTQGIVMYGADGRVAAFNPRACEILEVSAEFLQTRPTLPEITAVQHSRGDFGQSNDWVDPHARDYIVSHGTGQAPPVYVRQTRSGRFIEIKTVEVSGGGMVRTYTDVTDYRQQQQALTRTGDLLSATQAIAGVGGWESDLLTGRNYWTPEVYKILECEPAADGTPPGSLMPFVAPEWQAEARRLRQRLVETGEPFDQACEAITGRGRRLWVRAKGNGVFEDGRLVRVVAVVQDITEAKRAEAALKASEDLFRQITSQIPGAVYQVRVTPDRRLEYTYISAAVAEIFGVTAEQVMRDSSLLNLFLHPEDGPSMRHELEVSAVDSRSLLREFRVVRPDGTERWVQMISSEVSRDATGAVRVGVMFDITARKLAETALRERDALWKLALESTGDGVWDWNLQSGVEVFSPSLLQMYGFTAEEIAQNPQALDDRTHPDDVAEMQRARDAHLEGRAPAYVNEHRIRCKDGTWKWVLTRGMVISRDAHGRALRMTGTHTDITERKRADALIWQQANFDALTGLPNRTMLRDRLEQGLRQCRREQTRLALLFIDLDHFKEVNDTLGHDQGDALLVEAAKRISRCMRESDTLARMGGDEFTVVMPGLGDAGRMDRFAQDVIAALRAPFQLLGELAYISASIGIALYPDDGQDIDELFKHADQALYVAKGTGRNRFSYFTPQMQQAANLRLRLAHDLRAAITEGQFWLAYQPIVELASGRIHKAEALIRWQHPERGLVSPAQFIPVAESTGLIVEIGDWVFQEAMRQTARWREHVAPDFQVSINKSPVQFHGGGIGHEAWIAHVRAMGLPGDALVVEITEGLLLDDNPNVKAQLLAFRDAGIGASLDDFGTGYSSLLYLQQHDIDYLKIDQSFVRGLSADSKNLPLCKAIISMAHELGMKVVAEGVETSVQRDLLKGAGCDYAQGYLFSRPLAPDAFEAAYTRKPGA